MQSVKLSTISDSDAAVNLLCFCVQFLQGVDRI